MKYKIFILLFLPFFGYTQNPAMPAKHDAIWLSGYGSWGSDPQFGGLKFDFREYPMQVTDEYLNIEFQISGTTMCNSEGELIFSCNGDDVFDASDNIMDNGDGINPEENAPQTRINQSIFTLPAPDNEDLYYMFHSELFWVLDDTITLDGYFAGTFDFYYSLIDMSINDGLGSVVEKNQVILNDTIDFGKLTAVKHANGRDWWFLVPEYWSNNYYTFLLDPTGITEYPKQTVELVRYPGIGQAVFSPAGSKFVITGSRDTDNGGIHIDFFDFDRCTGLLSNQQRSFFSEITTLGKSVVISPNSKYAYFFANGKYYRYDLTEEDIPNSEELISDWLPFYQNGVIPVIPWASQLGADGKIYVASQSTVSYMDVIHDPDMNSIEDCRLKQGGLELPNRNEGTIANHPNYRLGPIDGSSCDTLGIDNLPIANFRYEVFTDTVLFRDLSAGAPNNWFWTFGDGAATNGQHQNKIYNGGLYEVCLTVSNENGSDTWCDSVQILTTDVVEQQQLTIKSSIFPNPSDGLVLLQTEQNLPHDSHFKVYNQAGRLVYEKVLQSGFDKQNIEMYDLMNGIYFYEILLSDFVIGNGKLVISKR